MTLESLGSHASNVAGALVAIYLVYQFVKGQFAIRDLREMEDCEDKWEKSRAESCDMIEQLQDRLGDVWNELTKAKYQASSASVAHHDAEIQCVKLREEIAEMTAEAARLAEREKADAGAANAQWVQWLGMHEEELATEKEKVANLTENYERLHEENKNLYKLCNADRRIFLESGRKILTIRNMAKLSVYPGGLEQLDADLRDVQDLLEGGCMRLSSDRLSCEITFDDYDDQDVMIPYSDGDDTEFYLGIGRVTLCGLDGQTLMDLANEIYKLFGKALPKGE